MAEHVTNFTDCNLAEQTLCSGMAEFIGDARGIGITRTIETVKHPQQGYRMVTVGIGYKHRRSADELYMFNVCPWCAKDLTVGSDEAKRRASGEGR